MLENLQSLITINKHKLRDILIRFNATSPENTIPYLEKYPNLRLDYLDNIFQTRIAGISQEIKIYYIKLLLKNKL